MAARHIPAGGSRAHRPARYRENGDKKVDDMDFGAGVALNSLCGEKLLNGLQIERRVGDFEGLRP